MVWGRILDVSGMEDLLAKLCNANLLHDQGTFAHVGLLTCQNVFALETTCAYRIHNSAGKTADVKVTGGGWPQQAKKWDEIPLDPGPQMDGILEAGD
jgi:hypothetical protein